MDRAATGICRRLLSAILQSEAARAEYAPGPGERNAGAKGIDIVSMFGPVGTVYRTYYYDRDNRRGHYPWDERMGLVGRYTPALVEEAARAAADDPYRKAAEKFARAHHFEMSGDTMRHIVGLMRAEPTSFVKLSELGPKEDANGEVDTVYVLADGTGLPFRRNALKGVKGKNGKAKTREVKPGVVFVGGVDSEGGPFRLQDTTTYVATTHRRGKFMRLLRAEFDRRFGRMHYGEYAKAGLFIGSGPVESGCKTVIGGRLKQSGMFWSLRGAKGMIPLRTLEKSGRFEEFFNYRLRHLRQVVSIAS